MSVSITQIRDDVCVIEFRGKLVIGDGDVKLRQAVRDALEQGYRRIVLDLHGAVSMDSNGLGELVRTKTTVANAGGQIVLSGVKDKIQDILEMTRLIGIFEEFDSPDDALMEIANV